MLSADETAELADMFRLLGDASRLGIILGCLDAPVSVGHLAESLNLSPSLVSHHLRLLRAARLVKGKREGRQVLYMAADDHVRLMLRDMIEHLGEPGESDWPPAPANHGD